MSLCPCIEPYRDEEKDGGAEGIREYGKNSYGTSAGPGLMYVWVYVAEGAGQNAATFHASLFDFQLRGDDGSIYSPSFGLPPDTHGQQGFSGGTVAEGDNVSGWLEFKVPARAGQYAFTTPRHDLLYTSWQYRWPNKRRLGALAAMW